MTYGYFEAIGNRNTIFDILVMCIMSSTQGFHTKKFYPYAIYPIVYSCYIHTNTCIKFNRHNNKHWILLSEKSLRFLVAIVLDIIEDPDLLPTAEMIISDVMLYKYLLRVIIYKFVSYQISSSYFLLLFHISTCYSIKIHNGETYPKIHRFFTRIKKY